MSKCITGQVEFIWLSPGPLMLTDGLTDLCTQV